MPIISIIVPAYGVAEYLARCITSILAQTFADFELILVDDGSPDNCGRICDEYAAKDNRVCVIHKENGGVSKARNAALNVAQGKYIAFCDGDDYWHERYLEKVYDAIENKSTDMVVVNYASVDEQGNILKLSGNHSRIIEYKTEEEKIKFITKDLLSGSLECAVWMRLFKREIITDNGLCFCETCGNYAEDLGFVLEYVLCSASACVIEESLYYYVNRSGSMMNRSHEIIKLDQINEVSHQVGERYNQRILDKVLRQKYPIIHFVLLYTELCKITGTPRYRDIRAFFQKVQKMDWCRKQLKALPSCRAYMISLFGKRHTQQILLCVHYCLHGNWKRFTLESMLFYKYLIERD